MEFPSTFCAFLVYLRHFRLRRVLSSVVARDGGAGVPLVARSRERSARVQTGPSVRILMSQSNLLVSDSIQYACLT